MKGRKTEAMKRRSYSIPQRDRSRGFTLLELLLAFVVFALSFATVMEILSGSMRNTVRARHYSEAALTAQSLMDQVGLEIPLEEGTALQGDAGNYRWELEIYNYAQTGENPASIELAELTNITLLQVDLVVSWGMSPREQSRRFSTIRALLMNRELPQ